MLLLNCALKLVEEIILYYDARSKKHQNATASLLLNNSRLLPPTVCLSSAQACLIWCGNSIQLKTAGDS